MASVEGNKGFTFIWRIENFSHLLERMGQCQESPEFNVDNFNNTGFYVSLYPRGLSAYCTSCCLHQRTSITRPETFTLDYDISFFGSNWLPLKSQTCYLQDDPWFRINREDTLKSDSEYLPDDQLTIRCCIRSIDGKPTELDLRFGRTRVDIQKTSFLWSIKDVGKIQPNRKKTIVLNPVSTQLQFYWTGELFTAGCIHICISQISTVRKSLSTCQINLLNASGEIVETKRDDHCFEPNSKEIWKFPTFCTKKLLFPQSVLYISCDISTSIGVVLKRLEDNLIFPFSTVLPFEIDAVESFTSVDENYSEFSHDLKDDLMCLYKSKKQSDVTLRTGSSSFPAHSIVLGARSPVFSSMFEKDMLESKTGVVDVPDLEDDTVDQMLLFFYTDSVKDLKHESAIKLYRASDKYDIPHLKKMCSSFLISNLNLANLCDILILSDMHNDQNFKEAVQSFILCHEREIFSSDEWKSLMVNEPKLALETMHCVTMRRLGLKF